MKNKYSEYFKFKSKNTFENLLNKEFEEEFIEKYPNYSTIKWKNKKLELVFYISFSIVEGIYVFSGEIYSKKRPSAINLQLFIPYYYPEFSKNMFELSVSKESDIEPEIDTFLMRLLSVFKTLPLSEIISGNLWLDGFSHHPHDQVLGIPWTPPEKIKF